MTNFGDIFSVHSCVWGRHFGKVPANDSHRRSIGGQWESVDSMDSVDQSNSGLSGLSAPVVSVDRPYLKKAALSNRWPATCWHVNVDSNMFTVRLCLSW